MEPGRRGVGLGRRIMTLLLDHPAVRRAPFVRLGTRDAQAFYERLGFSDAGTQRRWPGSSDMVLTRREPAQAALSRPA